MKTITKISLITLLNITFMQAQIIQKWLQVGSGTSKNLTSQPSMAFDRNGNLYLAFTDQSTAQNKATLKKFDGQTWTTLSSQFTPGQAQFVTLALDSGDMPCVAFQEPYPITKKITVMRFNGTTWDTIGARGFATADFNNPQLSFRITSSNIFNLAYRENSSGKASMALFIFGPNWVTPNSTNITQGDATKLSYNPTGGQLAFSNGAKNGKLSVITQTLGGSWIYVGDTTLSAGAVDYVTIRRFANVGGFATIITYKDLSDGKAYCISLSAGGTFWTSPVALSAGAANYVDLPPISYAGFNGNFYCAFADGNQSGNATVKKVNASAPSGSVSIGKEGFTDTLGVFAGAFYATMGIDKYDSLYLAVQSFNEFVVFKYRSINTNLVGISENSFSNELSVFPNPASTEITISTNGPLLSAMRLIDMNGQILMENSNLNKKVHTIDVRKYSSGVYFIESNQAGIIIRTKILKE